MSSILKALRKLEEERSRSEVKIPLVARDILKSPPRRRLPLWIAPACLGVVMIASGVSGYFLRGNLSADSPPANVTPLSAESLRPSQQEPESPAPRAPELPPKPAVSSMPPRDAAAVASESPRPSFTSRRPLPPNKAPVRAASLPPAAVKATVAPLKQAQPQSSAGKAALPALELTGIAFVKDRAGRLAIINGLPVMEGTVIAGARVREIRADRVRLDYSGDRFEIRLDAPGGR